MTQFISLEFLVAVLFIIDVVVILLLILFVRRVNRMPNIQAEQNARDMETIATAASDAGHAAAAEAAGEVRQILLPLVQASKEAAQEFDELIREKKKITKTLNDALDSKIISLNLLLSRAETLEKKLESHQTRIAPRRRFPPSHPRFRPPHIPRYWTSRTGSLIFTINVWISIPLQSSFPYPRVRSGL